MASDAQRWDDRYTNGTIPTTISPHPIVAEAAKYLAGEPGTRAGDVACGWGDAGLWLAAAGFDVTCFDISSVALDSVAQRALDSDVNITTDVHDTQTKGTPTGPWDLLTVVHYLDRDMLRDMSSQLEPGGVLAIAIATKTNLERHERPSPRFLLDPDELVPLVTSMGPHLDILRADEAWRANGVHEAWLIAQLPR